MSKFRIFQAQVNRAIDECPNPLLEPTFGCLSGPKWGGNGFRIYRAWIRILRVASGYLSTGRILDLEDPLGDRVLTRRIGESLRIWSVGKNGRNDGGTEGASYFGAPDIVVEVPLIN